MNKAQRKLAIKRAQTRARRASEKARGIAKDGAKKAHQASRQAALRAGQTAKKGAVVAGRAAVQASRLFRVNLANTLTLLNGVSGFLSILASMNGQYRSAAFLILAGVVFDYFDGKAARLFSEVTPLGRELDSLSDLISFGVAPAVLIASLSPSLLSYGAGALFVLSAALRLGRFNVQDLKGAFFGVPTTVNGVLLPALVLWSAPLWVYPWYLLVFAFLMNTPIRLKKVL